MDDSTTLDALFPGPKRLILCALYRDPDRWFTMPELAGRAGLQRRSLRAHIGLLLKGGLIREYETRGRTCFQANPDSRVFAEVQSIVTKLSNPADRGETILVVEDHAATARITQILLESWGYRVLEANGSEHALQIFHEHGSDIKLLLTDVMMPGMDGPGLADELQRQNPRLRIVYMSGYFSPEMADRKAAFLPKPFSPTTLSRTIRRELDRNRGLPRPAGSTSH